MIEIRDRRHEDFLKRRAAERSIQTGERLSTARALEDLLEQVIAAETDGAGSGRAA